ncbi:MAG TPA: FadR/GntR family transcriptional regulator [Mycobacteriales bacterium]|nr:FadR/GntR family transcriptional regulator [Mycobacteriales bacterium]
MASLGSGVRRETLSEQISRRLMEWMAESGLQPGDRLPAEFQLAETFGVSRPVVREALRALAALNIVEISTGKPARIKPFSPELISTYLHWGMSIRAITSIEIHEFRKGIEGEGAALAARRADPGQKAALQEIVTRMREKQDDFRRLGELDLQLHLQIAAASGNTLVQYVMESMHQPVAELIASGLDRMRTKPCAVPQMLDEHDAIVRAICAGDAEGARATAALVTERAIEGFRNAGQR